MITHGLGRDIILKTNFWKGPQVTKNNIASFEQSQCFIKEGQYENGNLQGFGRCMGMDGNSYSIGFF